jgi:SAM-dependent methyltransferase
MHTEQIVFIQNLKNTFPNYFSDCSVLEIGSYNVNGTIREYFNNCNYIGVDVGEGPCVDVVCSGHEYDGPDNSFDLVISTECFEHNPFWFETFLNMIRVCKSGGMVAFTCAGEYRPEHGTTKFAPTASPLTNKIGWGEYYKNLTAYDFKSRLELDNIFRNNQYFFIDSYYFDNYIFRGPMDLYFWGIKK